jgi:hypothetical protein
MVNDELYDQSTYATPFTFSLINIGPFSRIWGYSYAKTSKTEDIHLYVDATSALLSSDTASFNIPHICVSSLFNANAGWT